MIILAIETSCDETAAAVVDGGRGKIDVLSNVVSSQIEIHKKYGGVVPEVAAREHVLNIVPVVNEALTRAGIGRNGAKKKLDALAVTAGPGLITSLVVGVETAKSLAYAWKLPVTAVNHIEGHIYANFIDHKPKFPALILTVSGGHTMLVLMRGHGKHEIIGETRDDAAGEAFDKAAQLLGLGYPGGPAIAAAASRNMEHETWNTKHGTRNRIIPKIVLPRPMITDKSFSFSFSGLKTALLYALKKDKGWKRRVPEYATEFQQAVIDVLVHKTIKAAQKFGVGTVMLSGGVAANRELRRQLEEAVKKQMPGARFFVPDLKYTTDNAAMIAAAGYFHALRKDFTPWQELKADCNLEL